MAGSLVQGRLSRFCPPALDFLEIRFLPILDEETSSETVKSGECTSGETLVIFLFGDYLPAARQKFLRLPDAHKANDDAANALHDK